MKLKQSKAWFEKMIEKEEDAPVIAEKKKRGVTALAGWFGGDRMLCEDIGKAMGKCSWAGVPFAGGMSALLHINARTIVVNDRHRHIINLARVVASDKLRPLLIRKLVRKAFHPDELKSAQDFCEAVEPQFVESGNPSFPPDLEAAEDYFVCCWMGRASKAGIDDEFNGRPAIRWKADGGDSMVRYLSALRMLVPFSQTLRRCTFETMDAFDFLKRCEDVKGHGLYCDPPFPGVGRRYKHNAGQTDAEERIWHTALRDALERFQLTRVVCRFYEHPLISELYGERGWEWRRFEGRKQSNESAKELLLVRGPAADASLFA